MKVELIPVSLEEKPILANIMQPYRHELSAFTDHIELRADGLYDLNYFDEYWTEDNRYPYFIYADGSLAGFVLVNMYTVVAENAHSIAEFFVLNPYRRHGVGMQAAHLAFDQFPGIWELRVLKNNKPAYHFWQKCIREKTDLIEEHPEEGRYIIVFTIS